MDRLISLEPSNVVTVRIEPGQKCSGELTLRNVMYTMPVAFRLQPLNRSRYSVRPQCGIISPLTGVTVEIIYHLPPNAVVPDSFPHSDDSFLLHSVVAPGAAVKDPASTFDAVPNDWFTAKKKQVFIDSGVRIMFVGSAVLARLVAKGLMDEVREVLEKSEPAWKPANAMDSDGQTLLHLAIAQSRPDLVQLLLEFEPDIEARSRTSGSSPLEAAAVAGESLIVEILLANKASTERSVSSSWGPVHLAAGNGHVEVLRLLLLKGANVNALTKDGNTALHLAVKGRRRDCARLLLASGARADVRNGGDGDTPLHIAASSGDEQMVRLLLHKGAEKNIRNKYGKTAYDVAAENGHGRLFDALRLGDDLCAAARNGETRMIQKLLEHGANLHGRDQHGWTALHRAAFKGRVDAVRALIEQGISLDARDEDGYTALHCAVEAGQVDVTEVLVKTGADVEARTNKGVTALQIAEALHFSGITRILVQGGAYDRDGFMNKFTSKSKKVWKDETEVEPMMKKKVSRPPRSVRRSSFDRSVPLAVV
ncbi:PREDICTED: ankyrin repeat and protein kinase domain-containing protein 1-like isoform X3 [Ipomoea nil]|uniref:ankyrin repeat and protein kinase domain-containing protein 1-like isoform X3 n=1 Tax=Ipomoea nil TaxID=35883 RepID=UPI000901A133|nr:PREDICTED: ankyrin repeat and protein kinase domain-containing protein 1-like isoform X3 [Ipomoea nil]